MRTSTAGCRCPDAGWPGPRAVDRRYGRDDFVACYDNLTHWAKTMDRLGYDTMWLTEHHFQYEGYEVTPNLILFGLHLAKETARLRLGQMFNVVPQWHPLRLAEDAAMAQILTGDRMQFGVGRGTVLVRRSRWAGSSRLGTTRCPRSSTASTASCSRSRWRSSSRVVERAVLLQRKHFTLPPPGIPDRGSTVKDLTLIPKPIAPIDIWQAVTSPPTLEYCARVGHHAVIPARGPKKTKRWWDQFGERAAEHGWDVGPSGGRCLAVNAHVGRTSQEARRSARDPHDEWIKFLSPVRALPRVRHARRLADPVPPPPAARGLHRPARHGDRLGGGGRRRPRPLLRRAAVRAPRPVLRHAPASPAGRWTSSSS